MIIDERNAYNLLTGGFTVIKTLDLRSSSEFMSSHVVLSDNFDLFEEYNKLLKENKMSEKNIWIDMKNTKKIGHYLSSGAFPVLIFYGKHTCLLLIFSCIFI